MCKNYHILISDGLGIKRDYQQALKYFNLASQSGMKIHFSALEIPTF
jgi:TPR repeat protein